MIYHPTSNQLTLYGCKNINLKTLMKSTYNLKTSDLLWQKQELALIMLLKSFQNHLKPLYTRNEFIIGNTQDFSKLVQEQSPLYLDEEYVSYHIESLFTIAPLLKPLAIYLMKYMYITNYLNYAVV